MEDNKTDIGKNKMSNEKQIERIKKMEAILDEGNRLVSELQQALDKYESFAVAIAELEQYYTGGQWQKDFTDDEAGRLPPGLKRGVLTEDAVYDFLVLRDRVLGRLKK